MLEALRPVPVVLPGLHLALHPAQIVPLVLREPLNLCIAGLDAGVRVQVCILPPPPKGLPISVEHQV